MYRSNKYIIKFVLVNLLVAPCRSAQQKHCIFIQHILIFFQLYMPMYHVLHELIIQFVVGCFWLTCQFVNTELQNVCKQKRHAYIGDTQTPQG